MLHIYCPHCLETRSEEEFNAAGQADIKRPENPEKCTDKQWGEYLYFRKNTFGMHHEMWLHQAGCRKYFIVTRDTLSYEIYESKKLSSENKKIEETTADKIF